MREAFIRYRNLTVKQLRYKEQARERQRQRPFLCIQPHCMLNRKEWRLKKAKQKPLYTWGTREKILLQEKYFRTHTHSWDSLTCELSCRTTLYPFGVLLSLPYFSYITIFIYIIAQLYRLTTVREEKNTFCNKNSIFQSCW